MMRRINELIDEEYRAKLNEKNARMKALEAQINPHFLYNALQAISTQAIILQSEKLEKMVDALAYTLRYTIKEGDTVTVERELEQVENYIYIQKSRFGDRLVTEFDIQESCYKVLIPKLSIQSLVENAIKHALEKSNETITITIEGYLNETGYVFTVTDDGPGITPEDLKKIEALLNNEQWLGNTQESIGLKSVKERLKLLIGEGANLSVMNNNPWTKVVILITT